MGLIDNVFENNDQKVVFKTTFFFFLNLRNTIMFWGTLLGACLVTVFENCFLF